MLSALTEAQCLVSLRVRVTTVWTAMAVLLKLAKLVLNYRTQEVKQSELKILGSASKPNK